jgi:hypothetical protein
VVTRTAAGGKDFLKAGEGAQLQSRMLFRQRSDLT